MAYLFDTDALSEVMRREPNAAYVAWLRTVPREEQFASAVSVHGLALVTGNLRHHARVPGLQLETVLADARRTRAK